MYSYVNPQVIQKKKDEAQKMLKMLSKNLKDEYDISSVYMRVGSGSSCIVTADDEGRYDLDYNFIVQKVKDDNLKKNLHRLKDIIRVELDKIAKAYGYQPGQDSTSVITLKNNGYSLDIGILLTNKNKNFCRLIHDKNCEKYILNEISSSYAIKNKEKRIHTNKLDKIVREKYLNMKNKYSDQPSFDLYVQVMNNVLNNKN